jgi:hypothetical protein
VQQRGVFIPSIGGLLTPPYTVRTCLVPQFYEFNYWCAFLALRNSSTDERVTVRFVRNTTYEASSVLFDDQNTLTGGGTGSTVALTQGFPLWLQLRDDTTNLFFEVSKDGKNYQAVTTGSTGMHTTPDQAGLVLDSFGGGSGSWGAITVLSFEILNTA